MDKRQQQQEFFTFAKDILEEDWAKRKESTVSLSTRQSQNILKEWKKLCKKDSPVTPGDPQSAGLQFAVHDRAQGIIYELKVNNTNPHVFLDKLIRKLIIYHALTAKQPRKYPWIKSVYLFVRDPVIKTFSEGYTPCLFRAFKEKFGIDFYLCSTDKEKFTVRRGCTISTPEKMIQRCHEVPF